MRRALAGFLLLLLAAGSVPGAERQVGTGRGGAVAAAEETAARVGVEILKKGGNAADAAVAVAFALAVTWPEAGNIGGGGFWISRDSRGRVLVVDFREVAPRAARRDLYTRPDVHGVVPSSTEGPLSSGVPGSVAGLSLAHRRAGHLPWKTVVNPAVRLARDGFVVSEALARSISYPEHRDRLAKDPETARIFLPNGAPPPAGSVLKQPDLARTLEAIRDRRDDGFYRGSVARHIEAGQERDGGLIDRGDLARYEARIRNPVRFKIPRRGDPDDARPLLGIRSGRDGDARVLSGPREIQDPGRRLGAPAGGDREARLPGPQPLPGRSVLPPRPAGAPDRPGEAPVAGRVDRPVCARRRAARSGFRRRRSPRRRISR